MQRYYKQIHDMPPLSEQEMNAHLAEESRVRHGAVLGPGLCWDVELCCWGSGVSRLNSAPA